MAKKKTKKEETIDADAPVVEKKVEKLTEKKAEKPIVKESKKLGFVQIGSTWFNFDALKEMTEEEAVQMHTRLDSGRVINAWKKANGKK